MSNIISGEVVDEFESRFVKDEIEMLFLTVESVNGAAVLEDRFLNPSIEFVASVNLNTGTFSKEKADLNGLLLTTKTVRIGAMILKNSISITSRAERISL